MSTSAQIDTELHTSDAMFMDRALELAARGVALTSPNPMVGAVLVRGGQIVGEGFHTYDGLRHAEIIALDAAGAAARGATLYINLEPCCHTGRTGPCTSAVIQAGVGRVVAAMADPNPAVAGRGFEQLGVAGIEVSVGLRETKARQLNEAFARWVVSRVPFVTLKSALTLDGHLVLPGTKAQTNTAQTSRKAKRGRRLESKDPGTERWITSPESRAEVQRMRHCSDALLTGIGTVLEDNPLLTERTGLPRRRKLLRVILDSQLRLPLDCNIVCSADKDVLVFTRTREAAPKARALRRAGIEIVPIPGRSRRIEVRTVMAELGRRDILSVLLEAGSTLNGAFLAAGSVDKIRYFFAPKILGTAGHVLRRRAGAAFPANACPVTELRDVTVERFGPDFAVEGYLRDVYRTR